MRRSRATGLRRLVAAAAVAVAGFAAGCASEEASSTGCPLLCPGRDVVVRDTTFDAVSFDTTLVGFPTLGDEALILIATAPGGTLDTRGVLRFDSVATTYTPPLSDSVRPITAPDSARLLLFVDTTYSRADEDFTIEAYDVDTVGIADTALAPLASLVRPGRLVGSRAVSKDSIRDTLRLPLDPGLLGQALSGPKRVRLALRVRSSGRAAIALTTILSGQFPNIVERRRAFLQYRPSADSVSLTFSFLPSSATPASEPVVANLLRDRSWTVTGTLPVPTGQFAIGGMPAARAYLAFDIPRRIVDSSDVLRATLTITQAPYTGPKRRDSLDVRPYLVSAAPGLDLTRASELLFDPFQGPTGASVGALTFTRSLNLDPAGQGPRALDIAAALLEWRASGPAGMRRHLVLRTGPENFEPGQLRFWSSRAADPAVRPRLRIVYALPSRSGLP